MAKTVLFTGGGTAGHVTPNLALMERLQKEGYDVCYVGSRDGIERTLVEPTGVPYYAVNCGKLRRYFSWRNFTDPFRVLCGLREAKRILAAVRPAAVFSKGGFVSVPVVMAARHTPVVTHESDYTPGLANRINAHYADTVCATFEDTLQYLGKKGVHTGTPIRPALFAGKAERGLAFTGFSGAKPVLLVMGGSQGAQAVNEALRAALGALTAEFDIIHLCGKGKLAPAAACPGYVQYEYISAELPDLFAAADLVVSRAGANAVFELLALCKPMLLIPLPLSASRGDQLQNARYFARKGYAAVLEQENLTPESLAAAVRTLYANRLPFIRTMSAEPTADGTDEVLDQIRKAAERTAD